MLSTFILQNEEAFKSNENTSVWNVEKLQEYFSVIKSLNPKLTEDANTVLCSYYQAQRKVDSRNAARTTVRLLESLIRLSQGHARLLFRERVLVQDAIVAISLIESSMLGTTSIIGETDALHSSFPANPAVEYKKLARAVLEKLQLDDILRREMELFDRTDSNGSHDNPTTRSSSKQQNIDNVNVVIPNVNDKLATILNNIQKRKDRAIFDTIRCERPTKKRKSKTNTAASSKFFRMSSRIDDEANGGGGVNDQKTDDIFALLNLSSDSDNDETSRMKKSRTKPTGGSKRTKTITKNTASRKEESSPEIFVSAPTDTKTSTRRLVVARTNRSDSEDEIGINRKSLGRSLEKVIRTSSSDEEQENGTFYKPEPTAGPSRLGRDLISHNGSFADNETYRYRKIFAERMREPDKMPPTVSDSRKLAEIERYEDADSVPLFADFTKAKQKYVPIVSQHSPSTSRLLVETNVEESSSAETSTNVAKKSIREKLQIFAYSSSHTRNDETENERNIIIGKTSSKHVASDESSQPIFSDSSIVEKDEFQGDVTADSITTRHAIVDDDYSGRGGGGTNKIRNDYEHNTSSQRGTQRSMKPAFLSSLGDDADELDILNDL